MATKRFDDVAEKARALEAQAARTKAYADALVTVFPEVKGMGSAEEVLDFVKGLKPGTGHETPDACLALLDDFHLTNDPVRQFLDDILIRATWDVLPWQFVFDLYRRWFIRNNPSGRCQSRKSLINDVKGIISDYEGWDYSDNPVSVPDEMYDTPEGLIGMYEVREWEEPGYRGSNPNRSHLYRGSKRTRGLVRVGVAASEDATTTDSTNKEE
jgi:putative DNA primase/helicase